MAACAPYVERAYRPDGSARLVRGDEALDGENVVPGFRLELKPLFGQP